MSKLSEKISFPGSQGGMLSARLNRPDGAPKAYALFAHCFTYSKGSLTASRIAGVLGGKGNSVPRFDFTGLGASEEEFANTNFSSNVQDCIDCGEGRQGRIDRLERRLDLQGDLSEAELKRLVEIADRCPVHRTLEKGSSVITKLICGPVASKGARL